MTITRLAKTAITLFLLYNVGYGSKKKQKVDEKKTPYPGWVPTTRLYDPNYGFKQYWPGGDWKLLGKTLKSTPTTKVPPKVTPKPIESIKICGDDCPETYRPIKEVCVVSSTANDPRNLSQYTVMSYCEFLRDSNPKCSYTSYLDIKLVFVHAGKCSQHIVQNYYTPKPEGSRNNKVHPDYYTPDTFEMGAKQRIKKFINKFYDQNEWNKYYTGPVPLAPFINYP